MLNNAACCTPASACLGSAANRIRSKTLPDNAKILATVGTLALALICSRLVFPQACKYFEFDAR
jgi:hypothetical protein